MLDPSHVQLYDVVDGITAAATRQTYRSVFSLFLERNKIKDRHWLLQQHPRFIEAQIIDHIRFLSEERQLTAGSISVAVAAIFHFFEMNDVILNKRKVTRFIPEEQTSSKDRAYKHEEILHMLLKCDERSRVIILLMASTGMRIGAIPGLQIGDLEEIAKYDIYKINVYSKFPRDRYYCFCTPETKQAISSYLTYRKRFGDPLATKSPLIREQFEINDPFAAAHPKPIKLRTIVYIIEEILKRSGLKTKEVMRSHGLRKHAITMMIKAKLDYSSREYIVGHKVSRGLDVNYDRTSEEDRLAEYAKAIDLLTISPEHRLKKKVSELESEKTGELARLKAQLHENQQTMGETKALMKVAKAQSDNVMVRMNEVMSIIKRVQDPRYQRELQVQEEERIRQKIMKEQQQQQRQEHQQQ